MLKFNPSINSTQPKQKDTMPSPKLAAAAPVRRAKTPRSPEWVRLHSLLLAYLQAHRDKPADLERVIGPVRDELVTALIERLTQLSRIVVAKRGLKEVTQISEALFVGFLAKNNSFTQLILKIDPKLGDGFTWLYSVLNNAMKDRMRDNKGMDFKTDSIDAEAWDILMEKIGDVADDGLAAELGYSEPELQTEKELMFQRLQAMPKELRQTIQMRDLTDDPIKQEEAAQMLGVSLATFKRNHQKAMAILRGD
jgi:RNA polymerase sigma factor (sigma-70 family)